MMHWFGGQGYGMGYGYGGWIFMIIFWAAILFLIFYFVKILAGKNTDVRRESAEDILKKRYASGEISKEEYQSMKKELSS